MPCNLFGPNDNYDSQNSHFLPALIKKIYLASKKKKNKIVNLWGTGKPLREFIYSKDIAKLTKWVLEEYEETEPIILSTSHEISIRDLVDLLVQEFNFKGKVIFDDTKPDGQFRKPSDNSKIKKYLPDFEFTPIEVGIKETVNWFINNYENARK